jgi:hypothetical protein
MAGGAPANAQFVAAVNEKALTEWVCDLAGHMGWMVSHFHDSRRQVRPGVFVGDKSSAGFPDLVMLRGSRMVVVELKAEKGRLRPDQPKWLNGFVAAGAEVFLWRPSHWQSGAIDEVLAATAPISSDDVDATVGERLGLWVP